MDTTFTYTIPVLVKGLGGLKNVVQKAAEHGLGDEALLQSRLAPDMFPFVKQVQVACDNAKGAAARLSGTEAPVFEDTETTIAQLLERIDKTVAYLNTFTEAQFADAATRQVTLPYFPGKFMTGSDYAREFVLPNFFFHIAMAYALIRREGVAIGKNDYLNGLPLQDF